MNTSNMKRDGRCVARHKADSQSGAANTTDGSLSSIVCLHCHLANADRKLETEIELLDISMRVKICSCINVEY